MQISTTKDRNMCRKRPKPPKTVNWERIKEGNYTVTLSFKAI